MGVILGVAGVAGNLQGDEHPVKVAFCAFYTGMCPGERKLCQRVIKGGMRPSVWCMAGSAIRAELTLVSIILGVA